MSSYRLPFDLRKELLRDLALLLAVLTALRLDYRFDLCVLGERLLPLLDGPIVLLEVLSTDRRLLLQYSLRHFDVFAVYLEGLLLLVGEIEAAFPFAERRLIVIGCLEVFLVVVAASLDVYLVQLLLQRNVLFENASHFLGEVEYLTVQVVLVDSHLSHLCLVIHVEAYAFRGLLLRVTAGQAVERLLRFHFFEVP